MSKLDGMDIQEILSYLPHRYPFLLVDRILSYEPNKSVVAIKNVTMNEPYFTGHWPGKPVMPGVLILEAMAQATGILAYQTAKEMGKTEHYLYYFAGIDKARFKRIVQPGDQLRLEIEVSRIKKDYIKVIGTATVDGELACQAELISLGQDQKINIDPRAIIDPRAVLADDVEVEAFAYIGADVELGPGCKVYRNACLKGPLKAGKNNEFFQYVSIGEVPQDKKYHGEKSTLEIGDNNVFREYVTIHRGTEQGGGITKIGSDNLLMAYVHVAHDCHLGNHIILANSVQLAGHVHIEDHAIMGGFSGVHQFCRIGAYSFLSRAKVGMDVLPFLTVAGDDAYVAGLNIEGLKRYGFNTETINVLRKAYKIIFRSGLRVEEAIKELEILKDDCAEVGLLINGLKNSSRGIIRKERPKAVRE